jgi:hypothetical protein
LSIPSSESKSKHFPYPYPISRYPKKSHKNPAETRYWKGFTDIVMRREGFLQNDLHFCAEKPHILASACSTRVDIYKLEKPEETFGDEMEDNKDDEFESLKPA